MTSLARRTTIVFIVLGLALSGPLFAFAVEDAIIAVVNDELITLKDLKDYARSTYIGLVAEGLPEDEIQAVMERMETEGTNQLIEDKLILSEANKLGLEVREELVDKRVKELEDRYGSNQKLTNALIKSGATLTDLKNKIRNEMKLKYIVEHQVKSKIYINPQEVTDYYEKNKETFGRQERVSLESIFIGYQGNKEAAVSKANEALKKIEEGGDFQEIAKTYSEMPSVGAVEHGQLLPRIEEIVFALEVGKVSPLVETDTGVYIFKAAGKTPAEIPSLQEEKQTITDLLTKKKFEQRFAEWLGKLKKDAYIEIK
jgi:parvulin-like peptidyl-prolyl isomerase